MFRNNIYFKNIAIAVYRLQYEQELTAKIFKQVIANCNGTKEQSLTSWLKWCNSQKHLVKVNFRELKDGGFYGTK